MTAREQNTAADKSGGTSCQETTPENGSTDDSAKSSPNVEEQLRAELQSLNERWLRSEAEMDNLRRRTRREIEDNAKFANQRLMVDLMDVVDNLHRALGVANHSTLESLVAGVQMVSHQFDEAMKRHGCQRISTVGEMFDPNFHEAVQMVPCDSPAGSVVQEVRTGYRLHDRLIRPAQVIVAAG
ncbi:MAG: nucleotide exchange factor GrpE [Pirellulaceae bacterium]|nr:nucleotide exchange factor GrpE [Pirellulaceae bacterium]